MIQRCHPALPELRANQLSCHAAHEEGGCEAGAAKCRRIVGMLSVIGGDPHRCGYTDEQIAYALKASTSAHQTAGRRRCSVVFCSIGRAGGGAYQSPPEVMRLRFDKGRSPLDVVPEDIRKPLYDIVLPYLEGMVIRKEGKWVDLH